MSLALFAFAPDPSTDGSSVSFPYPPYPNRDELVFGEVTRILDENTVLIKIADKHERYDLLGIASFPVSQSAHAIRARDALARMLLHEQVAIHHEQLGKRNAANRLVGYLYRQPDRTFVNLELIRQGYARYASSWVSVHTEVFEQYASRAESQERGIWGPDAPPSEPEAEPETHELKEPSAPSVVTPVNQPTIYITQHGSKYHREGCPHLTDTTKPTTREKVKGTHGPCKTCKPDG
jgi:endonuclease YncB( thermonuclease family)